VPGEMDRLKRSLTERLPLSDRELAMRVEQQPPAVYSLLLADAVHRDSATGKAFLLGIYSQIKAQSFPCLQPALVVYATLRGGRGRTLLKFRLIDEGETREPLFEIETMVDFPDPLTMVEVFFKSPQVTFAQPANYRLQLYGGGQLLQEYPLRVDAVPSRARPMAASL
jgi:hypothetical protein